MFAKKRSEEAYIKYAVGTSNQRKINQSEATKASKKCTKRVIVQDRSNTICKNFKRTGHSTSRSPICPNHTASISETVKMVFRDGHRVHTTRLPYNSCVKEKYNKGNYYTSHNLTCLFLKHRSPGV
ncbi:hypothetical protein BDF21DRAFT_397762 [Thamnidium elegans]|nr:hypothetical protein BDF21DRAFT_397762 [Thamnidium elegans]